MNTPNTNAPYRSIEEPDTNPNAISNHSAVRALQAALVNIRHCDTPIDESDCKELMRSLWCEATDIVAQLTALGVLFGIPQSVGGHMAKGAEAVKAVEVMMDEFWYSNEGD